MNQTEYIIGQIIRFVPSSEKLTLVSDEDISVALTPACNRLLAYLIANQGQVLSRDTIFATLWEQYGYTPSNGSLNTYMSLIRKAFVNLGFNEEVISTIPKTGFLFNPDISVETINITPHVSVPEALPPLALNDNDEGEISEVIHTENSTDAEPIMEGHFTEHVPRSGMNSQIKWIILFVVVFVTGCGLYFLVNRQNTPPVPVEPLMAGKLGECSIYYLPTHPGDIIMFSEKQARFMVKQSGLPCTPGGVFYMYADRNVTSGQSGKIYVSRCQRSHTTINACRNYADRHLRLPAVIDE